MQLDDRIIGILLGLLAVATIVLARQIPAVPGTTFGPELMPTLIGVALAGAAGRIFYKGFRVANPGPWLDVSDWHGQTRGLVAAAWSIAGTILALLFFNHIGFPLYAFFFALPLMLLLGAKPLMSVIISLALALVAFVIFSRLLLVPLPVGPLQFLR